MQNLKFKEQHFKRIYRIIKLVEFRIDGNDLVKFKNLT